MNHLDTAGRVHAMGVALGNKLSGFFAGTDALSQLWPELGGEIVEFAAGERIVGQEEPYGPIYVIESGWVTRARLMEDGSRQIVSVAVAGDMIALNALLFRQSDYEHRCKTAVGAFQLDPERLLAALSRHPRLASALFWVSAHEESILAERIVSLGRRATKTRAAHVLCEFIARLDMIGTPDSGQFAIPLSQDDFADILGVSLVHVNRCLRALARDGVVSFRHGVLLVHDRPRLEHIAGFDSGYLHFTRRRDVLGAATLILPG